MDSGAITGLLGKVAEWTLKKLEKRINITIAGIRAYRRKGDVAHDSAHEQIRREFQAFLDASFLPPPFPYYALKVWFQGSGDFNRFVRAYNACFGDDRRRFERVHSKFLDDVRRITPNALISPTELTRVCEFINARLSNLTEGPETEVSPRFSCASRHLIEAGAVQSS
jgi:hypothetical protein